jgi:uncharacterized protein (DUF885 family)
MRVKTMKKRNYSNKSCLRNIGGIILLVNLAGFVLAGCQSSLPGETATQQPGASQIPSLTTASPSPTQTADSIQGAISAPLQPGKADVSPLLTLDQTIAVLEGLPIDDFFEQSYKALILRSPQKVTALGLADAYGMRNDQLDDLSDEYQRGTWPLEAAILDLLHTYDRQSLTQEQQINYEVYKWYLDMRVEGHRFGYHNYPLTHYLDSYQFIVEQLFTDLFHEAIPGHHYQFAISYDLDLPTLRNDILINGYVEGWALYAEQLAWELGMYENNPHGNVGHLTFELLRAARLVVDTGLHSMKWTRQEAQAYMERTLGGFAYEVDRYVVAPAQATGYKIGMLRMLELRRLAQEELGEDFDLVGFHRVILGNGSLPLEMLERMVREYIGRSS